ncbi:polysaccharide biosynthesis tyrosine autokinase [Luteolibacter sp. AS25]|uniref:polysaccharide biosynthesis tyrosine autokinase n=1 Tax=Luteolibacter sp. AS25 TaxID=3135776 RepID=UPI00398ADA62
MIAQRRSHLKAVEIRDQDTQYSADSEEAGNSSFARQERQERLRMIALDLAGRWYWIVLFLGIGLALGFYVLSKTPKKYTADTVLRLKEQTAGLMGGKNNQEGMDMSTVEAMNTVAAHIVRMELLEKVAQREDVTNLKGLEQPPIDWIPFWVREKIGNLMQQEPSAELEENVGADVSQTADEVTVEPIDTSHLAGMIGSWVSVSIREGTRLLDITVTHEKPEVARVVADAVALEYLDELANDRIAGRSNSIEILEKQSAEARANLQKATGSLAIYNRAIEVHGLLDEKETEYNRLQGRYREMHPKMIAVSAEIRNLEKQFLSEYEIAGEAPNEKQYWEPIMLTMPDPNEEPERYFLIARQQLLARTGVLESEIKSSTSVFNSMLTLIEESLVDRQSTTTSAEISSLARMPWGPSSPNSANIVGMYAFAGLSGGLFLALGLTLMDNRFHTVSQFTGETGANVLASIPFINLKHLNYVENKYKKAHEDVDLEKFKDWDKLILFRPGVSDTTYAEMYRVLRASVALLGDESARKVTVFSSALPGEGKTITSVNFALAAAAQGQKTLLIDLDLRKPNLHRAFGFKPMANRKGGASEYLSGQISVEDAIYTKTGVPNFDVILSGKRSTNPGESIHPGRLMALLAEARSKYDQIIIDSAPLLPVPDTRVIAPLADNFCIVCRANYVPKGAVKHLLEVLEEDRTEISGFIFNGFEQKRSRLVENNSYGYFEYSKKGKANRYGYGSYGAYGSDYED